MLQRFCNYLYIKKLQSSNSEATNPSFYIKKKYASGHDASTTNLMHKNYIQLISEHSRSCKLWSESTNFTFVHHWISDLDFTPFKHK